MTQPDPAAQRFIWRWPARPGDTLLPWYRIAWNVIWIGPALVALSLLVSIIFCWRGPRLARQVWMDVT